MLVASNHGPNSGDVERTAESSVTGSRATRRSESYKQEVKLAYEREQFLGGKGTVEVTVGFEQSNELAETLERTQSSSISTSCKAGPGITELFQWKVDVSELCYVKDGGCQTSIGTLHTLCTSARPQDKFPICPPTHCADDYCTVCK
ncbi:MAG TPA: hypothetical protein VG889_13185 [Rhizomicrobium sp.]|nr:hypothetical protein [Rhizomicrobium sp.]